MHFLCVVVLKHQFNFSKRLFRLTDFIYAVDRLSERNCIEIVTKLIAEKQLEVVHTLDGKEYVTPAQISKEIRDELHVCGGKCGIYFLPLDLEVSSEDYRRNLKVLFSSTNLAKKPNQTK